MKCNVGPGGSQVSERGLCPAANEKTLNGANDGLNGGRSCWVVTNTLCDNRQQGSFFTKLSLCSNCEFYKTTYKEERFPKEKSTAELLMKVKAR